MFSEIIFIAFHFLLGTAVGSFLNVWSGRLLLGKAPTGRSHCEHCKRVLAAADLVPLLSFALLRGRCRYCRKPISWRHPIVEGATGVIFAALATGFPISELQFSSAITETFLLIAVSSLIVVFITDLAAQLIFDQALWIAGGGAFLYRLLVRIPVNDYRLLAYDLIGALGVFLFLQAIRLITRRRGMGEGDPPLGLVTALLVGFPLLLVELFITFVSGGATGAVLVLSGKNKLKDRVAFGPFLVAATFVTILFGERVWSWYLGVLGL